MMNETTRTQRPLLAATTAFAIALLVGGCATVQDWADSVTSAVSGSSEAPEPGRARLAEGVDRYDAGDFVSAIRALNAPEIEQSDVATRVEAGKYLAFSYCVTNRRALCRKTFDRVLTIDPAFALKPAEAGHPLWGPVFVQARKAADKRAN